MQIKIFSWYVSALFMIYVTAMKRKNPFNDSSSHTEKRRRILPKYSTSPPLVSEATSLEDSMSVDSTTSSEESGIEVNENGECQLISLINATSSRSYKRVRSRIRQGANVNEVDNQQRTALMFAALKGNLKVVEDLIQNGAEVNAVDIRDETALMSAASNGKLHIVKFLIQNGAEVKAVNNRKETALNFAASGGFLDVVEFLIQSGAEVNAVDFRQDRVLMNAVYGGHLSVVQFLIKNGAVVNAANIHNRTALMPAAHQGYTDIVKFLIESGADVNVVSNEQETALILAASTGRRNVVEFLIDSGAEVNAANSQQETALILAAFNKYSSVVRLLIEGGADVNAATSQQKTALFLAASSQHFDIAKVLIENGASLKQSLRLEYVQLFDYLRKCSEWNLKDLEAEYEIISTKVDSEKKEQQLNLLWIKVESWIILGANVHEVIHEVREESVLKNFPQINLGNELIVESFLFNCFEFFHHKDGYFRSALELSVLDFTVEDFESLFILKFHDLRNDEFDSVNHFLRLNFNAIRFAEYIQEEDLLNKVADLLVSFNISNFEAFWRDFKLVFGEFVKKDNSWIIYPAFLGFSYKLLRAAVRKGELEMIGNIVFYLSNENVGFDAASFLDKIKISNEDIRNLILSKWRQ